MSVHRYLISHAPGSKTLGRLLVVLFCITSQSAVLGDSTSPTLISIWDREVPGMSQTYADVSQSEVQEENLDPVLLPLPAPLVAAGLGLMGVYVLKRRFSRI